MKALFPLLAALLLLSCSNKKDLILLTYELNTAGVKHKVDYADGFPKAMLYETYRGSGARDTIAVDTALESKQYFITYDINTGTALVTQNDSPFRKYYFNPDNLLSKITRFDSKVEYLTDSVSYDYTTKTASFFDLINRHVYELTYDSKNNIESETQKRIADQHLFKTCYYYYDASRNPFLVNLDEDEELFGCFNYRTIGLFWNNASRPIFSSRNNVQSFKEVDGKDERHGLFEYQYLQGIPMAQFGSDGVIYYHYQLQALK